MELAGEMGKIGQHIPLGLLSLRRGALVTHHAILTPGPLPGARVWTQPPVGTWPRAGCLPHAVLSPVAAL